MKREILKIEKAHKELSEMLKLAQLRIKQLAALPHYDAVATEHFEARGDGEKRYLILLFPLSTDGKFTGPDGRRKLYIGCSDFLIECAQQQNERRRFLEHYLVSEKDVQKRISKFEAYLRAVVPCVSYESPVDLWTPQAHRVSSSIHQSKEHVCGRRGAAGTAGASTKSRRPATRLDE